MRSWLRRTRCQLETSQQRERVGSYFERWRNKRSSSIPARENELTKSVMESGSKQDASSCIASDPWQQAPHAVSKPTHRFTPAPAEQG